MDVDENQQDSQASAIDIGARLCEARDNLGLDSEKIAKELNLAVEIITKIEQNVFHQDIPVAFIRGYVKAYSTKVGLDTPKILAEFDAQTSGDAPSLSRVQTISKFDSGRRELDSGSLVIKVISTIVILLFLSYGGYEIWKRLAADDAVNHDPADIALAIDSTDEAGEIELNSFSDDNLEEQSAALSTQTTPSQAPVEPVVENDNKISQTDANLAQSNLSEQAPSTPPVELESLAANTSPVESNNITSQSDSLEMTPLVLDFSADCWVRIVDARGEVIALGVKRAGKHMPIEGVKPINVVLGDPSVVTLKYNNQDYDLSGYRAGRRAEIILD